MEEIAEHMSWKRPGTHLLTRLYVKIDVEVSALRRRHNNLEPLQWNAG
jgi:hypothetical protein